MSLSKSLRIRDLLEVPLIIPGQGVFVFTTEANTCSFVFSNKNLTDGILVNWSETEVRVTRTSSEPYLDPKNSTGKSAGKSAGLVSNKEAFYWFSIDAQNQRLYAGVGEARLETSIYSYQLPNSSDDERKANKAFLESLTTVGTFVNALPLKLLRDPITKKLPHLVRSSASLDAIAKGLFMPISHLSPVSRQMYECIKDCQLDTDDFPEFSQAIQQSILDGWCHKRLLEKSSEFSKTDPNVDETYLRITLSENNGESPGIPYVLEIWPAGHYSPVHSHGNAEAIIKVLHGDIQVQLFPYLSAGVLPFATASFTKDDVMWISPNLNQIHQLKNVGTGVSEAPCMTIQCYMYDNEDMTHYDYFDYLDEKGIKQYEPDSDMDFTDFKELMKKEWANRKPNVFACFGQ